MDRKRTDSEPMLPEETARLTRAQLLKTAGAAGAGVILSGGAAQAAMRTAASLAALPKGAIGGPTGFAGAQRYQYGANTAAGRAAEALRRITKNGNTPLTINMRMWTGAERPAHGALPHGRPSRGGPAAEGHRGQAQHHHDRPDRADRQEPRDDRHARRLDPPPRHCDRGQRRLRGGRARDAISTSSFTSTGPTGSGDYGRPQPGRDDDPVQRQHLCGLDGWGLPGLGLPDRPLRQRQEPARVQGQVRVRPRLPEDVGRACPGRRLLHQPREEDVRLHRPQEPVLGLCELDDALRQRRGPQPVLLRPPRQAADQQPGGHPGHQGARGVPGLDLPGHALPELADRVRSDGRGECRDGELLLQRDQVHPKGKPARQGVRQVHPHRRRTGPHDQRQTDPPLGDLRQQPVHRQRLLGPHAT